MRQGVGPRPGENLGVGLLEQASRPEEQVAAALDYQSRHGGYFGEALLALLDTGEGHFRLTAERPDEPAEDGGGGRPDLQGPGFERGRAPV